MARRCWRGGGEEVWRGGGEAAALLASLAFSDLTSVLLASHRLQRQQAAFVRRAKSLVRRVRDSGPGSGFVIGTHRNSCSWVGSRSLAFCLVFFNVVSCPPAPRAHAQAGARGGYKYTVPGTAGAHASRNGQRTVSSAAYHTKQSICIIPLKSQDPLAVLFSFLERFIYKEDQYCNRTHYIHTYATRRIGIRNFGYTIRIQLDHIHIFVYF